MLRSMRSPKKGRRIACNYVPVGPFESSVNDYISKEVFGLKYSTVDNAIAILQCLGPSAAMAKVDKKHAFRLCPVRREDWNLLGLKWNGKFYVGQTASFWLTFSTVVINRLANSLHWILVNESGVVNIIHYLDDFLIAAPSAEEWEIVANCLRSI